MSKRLTAGVARPGAFLKGFSSSRGVSEGF